jgi:hypothetical protein
MQMKPGGPLPDSANSPALREVLENSAVRRRIIEYLGGPRLEDATCLFLARLDPLNPSRFERHPPGRLHSLLDESCELARSLEDTVSMLIHLDIEYVNFDDPAAAYLDPQRVFLLQEPLVRVIESRLLSLGIRSLHVVTGQGHHFVWKIRKCSPVAKAIARLGICTTPAHEPAPAPLFPHVALLMEHLAHLIKPAAAAVCEIPVEITAQHVGPSRSGSREMLSIDISEYGDPLASRMIRIPYTVYRKPWISGLIDRLGISEQVPAFFTLPLHEMDVLQLIAQRHNPDTIIDLAHRAGVEIPLEETGTRHLLDAYLGSGLIGFHRRFYSHGVDFPPHGHEAAAASVMRLPPCARHVLAHPNDLLLKPSGIQLVTRCLLAEGWLPRNIAALVTSIFKDPAYEWTSHWDDYDPVLRAEFYVRLFAGQIDQGIERGIDFNCFSQQEKQFCWEPDNCSLEPSFTRIYASINPHPVPS